jgi:phosphohistidine phosphatase
MQLLLIQHGEAIPEEIDPERPLTAKGREDILRLADFLGDRRIRVSHIVHSGKIRSKDSATMLAARIGEGAVFEQHAKILPKDSTEWLVDAAGAWKDDTLVVGHQPFMSRFVSRLVLGSETPLVAEFTPGTAVCLGRRGATGGWFVAWMLPPDLLKG